MPLNCVTVDSSTLQRGCQDCGLTSFFPGWSQPGKHWRNAGHSMHWLKTSRSDAFCNTVSLGLICVSFHLLVMECLFSSTCPTCTTAKYILSHPYQILFVFQIFKQMLCHCSFTTFLKDSSLSPWGKHASSTPESSVRRLDSSVKRVCKNGPPSQLGIIYT